MKSNVPLAEDVLDQHDNLPADADPRASLILRLGRALQELGSPAHRLESAMQLVADRLGLQGQFFSSPTGLFAALGDGHNQQTYMIRARNGDINLSKLSDINEVLMQLEQEQLSVHTAAVQIQKITEQADQAGPFSVIAAFTLTSAAVSSFFGGSWYDMGASLIVGFLIGLLAVSTSYFDAIKRGFEPFAAMIAAFVATVIANYTAQGHAMLVTMAGLIILIPGLTFTVSVRELATGQLVSGSSRMAGALVLFMTLGLGVMLGMYLGEVLTGTDHLNNPVSPPVPVWVHYAALIPVTYGFTVLFKARVRDSIWILIACFIAIQGMNLGNWLLDPKLAVSMAAFLVGCSGNLFSRITRRPAGIMQMPGTMLLVPGSLGFRGLTALLQDDVVNGIQIAFNASLTAVALTTGLLMASIVIPPKRDL